MQVTVEELLYKLAAAGASQKIAISTTAAQSAAITASIIELTPTVDCYVRTGTSPTAVNTGVDHFLLGGTTQFFRFNSGEKISIIADSGAGVIHISPVR